MEFHYRYLLLNMTYQKKFKNSAFSLKLVTDLFSSKIGRLQDIFFLLWKDFSTDQ